MACRQSCSHSIAMRMNNTPICRSQSSGSSSSSCSISLDYLGLTPSCTEPPPASTSHHRTPIRPSRSLLELMYLCTWPCLSSEKPASRLTYKRGRSLEELDATGTATCTHPQRHHLIARQTRRSKMHVAAWGSLAARRAWPRVWHDRHWLDGVVYPCEPRLRRS